MNFKRKVGETEEQFLWRLGEAKDSGLLDYSWEEIADIMNKEFRMDESEYRTEAAYRKPYQMAKRFYDKVFSKMSDEKYFKELSDKKRELERAKVQFRDERNAWNKQNRVDARLEERLNYMEDALKKISRVSFGNRPITTSYTSNNDLIVVLSDWHIGATYSSYWGTYSVDIAKDRIAQLLEEVLLIQETYKAQNCYVFCVGDMINGNIHASVKIENSIDVIDQVITATELLSSFCYELCGHFEDVTLAAVTGNHSRIDKKEDAIHSERLERLMPWMTRNILQQQNNFFLFSVGIDTSIEIINIRGKDYVLVHGDYDGFNKSGAQSIVTMLGTTPEAIVYGHLHTSGYLEEGNIKLIRGGCLGGAGNGYTTEKRLVGKPYQTVLVVNEKGIKAHLPVCLE